MSTPTRKGQHQVGQTARHASSPFTSIPLTGTWFSRVGLEPYQLLGGPSAATRLPGPVRPLPHTFGDLAA